MVDGAGVLKTFLQYELLDLNLTDQTDVNQNITQGSSESDNNPGTLSDR